MENLIFHKRAAIGSRRQRDMIVGHRQPVPQEHYHERGGKTISQRESDASDFFKNVTP
jgi:hypothetical protein